VNVFPFIKAEKVDDGNVTMACRLLEVSRSAYYEWSRHVPSRRRLDDEQLGERIQAIYDRSRGTYGWPRVHRALRNEGVHASRKRVARIMRQKGLVGRCKRRSTKTTTPDPEAAAVDLLKRAFGPATVALDRVYVGDITYVRTWEGWAYLATVIDLASRRVVGWAIADHMRAELVCDALRMAIEDRRPSPGLIFHSDRGTQGEFKRSSQHLDVGGGWRWVSVGNRGRRGRCGARCAPRDDRPAGSETSDRGFGSRSPREPRARRQPQRSGWHPRLAVGGSVRLAGCDQSASPRCRTGTSRSSNARRSPSSRPAASACAGSLAS
jgi:transposase InsO family protein